MFARCLLSSLALLQLLHLYSHPWVLCHESSSEFTKQIKFHQNVPVSLPHSNPTKSFWTHGTPDANPLAREGSDGDLTPDADTVIIGSGITGIGAAYHLSQLANATGLSHKVVVLEARDFCSGATGRNGGHLTPRVFEGFRKNSDRYNVDEAAKSLLLEGHTTKSIISILKSSGHEKDVDLVEAGHIRLFFTDSEEFESKADWKAATNAGIYMDGVRFLSKNETQSTYGPAFPSVKIPGNNLWPLKAVTYIFRLAQQTLTNAYGNTNVFLHTHTPVLSIRRLDPISNTTDTSYRWLVETHRGTVRARNIIHATNGYAAHLLPFLSVSGGHEGIVPTRGQVISTRASVKTDKILPLAFGGNEGYEYWFPRPLKSSEGNFPLIILGGGRESAGANHESGVTDDSVVNPLVSARLRGFLPTVYPEGWFKRSTEPEMEWTGIMGYTQSADPLVGPVMDRIKGIVLEGQYIAAGYTGHGMPRAFGCAEVLAQMIMADSRNETWARPEWFPEHLLTTSKW